METRSLSTIRAQAVTGSKEIEQTSMTAIGTEKAN